MKPDSLQQTERAGTQTTEEESKVLQGCSNTPTLKGSADYDSPQKKNHHALDETYVFQPKLFLKGSVGVAVVLLVVVRCQIQILD